MESYITNRLSTLGHPQRLALFRLLMRRYPDRVPATELARALALKPNTLSTYVNALMHAGLVTQERAGTSLRYAIDMDTAHQTIDYLMHDCCRGRPEICAPDVYSNHRRESLVGSAQYTVLFICSGNSTRSIFAEAILNDLAGNRFVAHSAGTKPRSELNPVALEVLEQMGHDVSVLRSKNVAEFQGADAPRFDFVFTVCNEAANEECSLWSGQPVSAHWGLSNPIQTDGSAAETSLAFRQMYDGLHNRIAAFTALPFQSLDRLSLQKSLDEIGQFPKKGEQQ
ncbi:helix-turn-helix domain-containing protein [Nereida sp. NH-UV-3]|uniref:arsenate reductase/protein-tyrosine-phosphatase family protein n=1 Tax=Nereida TaxID=282198 RepID=UPI0036F247D7